MTKKIFFSVIAIILVSLTALPSLAQETGMSKVNDQTGAFFEQTGLAITQPGDLVSSIIKIALSLLGIIFLGLTFYAGYLWMTANGNEDQVSKAKDTLKTAIIGLVIIVAAYSITYFVFRALGNATGAGGGTNQPVP